MVAAKLPALFAGGMPDIPPARHRVLAARVAILAEENRRLKLSLEQLRDEQVESLRESREKALLICRDRETAAALQNAQAQIAAVNAALRKREEECHAAQMALRRKNALVSPNLDKSPATELEVVRRQLKRSLDENERLRARILQLEAKQKPFAERQLSVNDLDTTLVSALKSNMHRDPRDTDEYGVALMEQLAEGMLSPITDYHHYSDARRDEQYAVYADENCAHTADPRDREMDLLEHFLHHEHRLRVRSEHRTLQLMQILDDRLYVENNRLREETDKNNALQASLQSVRRALAAERAARQELHRHTTEALKEAAQVQRNLCGDFSLPHIPASAIFMSAGQKPAE